MKYNEKDMLKYGKEDLCCRIIDAVYDSDDWIDRTDYSVDDFRQWIEEQFCEYVDDRMPDEAYDLLLEVWESSRTVQTYMYDTAVDIYAEIQKLRREAEEYAAQLESDYWAVQGR